MPPKKSRAKVDIDEEEYEVESIIDRKIGKDDVVRYLVKWKGYIDPTWEPASECINCRHLIDDYKRRALPKDGSHSPVSSAGEEQDNDENEDDAMEEDDAPSITNKAPKRGAAAKKKPALQMLGVKPKPEPKKRGRKPKAKPVDGTSESGDSQAAIATPVPASAAKRRRVAAADSSAANTPLPTPTGRKPPTDRSSSGPSKAVRSSTRRGVATVAASSDEGAAARKALRDANRSTRSPTGSEWNEQESMEAGEESPANSSMARSPSAEPSSVEPSLEVILAGALVVLPYVVPLEWPIYLKRGVRVKGAKMPRPKGPVAQYAKQYDAAAPAVFTPRKFPGITVWTAASYAEAGHKTADDGANAEEFLGRTVEQLVGYVKHTEPFVLIKLAPKSGEEDVLRVADAVQAVDIKLAVKCFSKALAAYTGRIRQGLSTPSASSASSTASSQANGNGGGGGASAVAGPSRARSASSSSQPESGAGSSTPLTSRRARGKRSSSQ